MKKMFVLAVVGVLMMGAGAAFADGHVRYVATWDCTVKDGKSIDDVKAVNSKWVAMVNAKVEGGDIRSYTLTPVVGELGGFMFVDSFPSLEAWQAVRGVMASDEGKALEAEFDAVSECSQNSLHESTQS